MTVSQGLQVGVSCWTPGDSQSGSSGGCQLLDARCQSVRVFRWLCTAGRQVTGSSGGYILLDARCQSGSSGGYVLMDAR